MKVADKPYFQAYTQLTLVLRFKNYLEKGISYGNQKSDIGLSEFISIIQEGKVVDSNLSRDTSDYHKKILEDRLKYSGNYIYSTQVSNIVNQALLVGYNEQLISRYGRRV
jgi:hypothetical protein